MSGWGGGKLSQQVCKLVYLRGNSLGIPKKGHVLDLGPLHMSPVDRAGSVTGMNFALGSYEKFQPGFRDEKRSKILGTSFGAKFGKQSKRGETQNFLLTF